MGIGSLVLLMLVACDAGVKLPPKHTHTRVLEVFRYSSPYDGTRETFYRDGTVELAQHYSVPGFARGTVSEAQIDAIDQLFQAETSHLGLTRPLAKYYAPNGTVISMHPRVDGGLMADRQFNIALNRIIGGVEPR